MYSELILEIIQKINDTICYGLKYKITAIQNTNPKQAFATKKDSFAVYFLLLDQLNNLSRFCVSK